MAKLVSMIFIFISSIIMIHQFSVVNSTQWCVPTLTATNAQLQSNINFACSHGVDCRPIQPGGYCYTPNTLVNHASFVMNSYYQSNGRTDQACRATFGFTGTFTVTNPSFGSCVYKI
ncbi:unnamed protein product [Cochlearia groenlandica]